MNIKTPLSIFSMLFCFILQAQIDVEKPVSEEVLGDSPTSGFFVNDGQTKLSKMSCYTFKNLVVAFDLKKEHFECDRLDIKIRTGDFKYREHETYTFYIEKKDLEKFKGKEYAYVYVFTKDDLKENSPFLNLSRNRYYPMTRSRLQHTWEKNYDRVYVDEVMNEPKGKKILRKLPIIGSPGYKEEELEFVVPMLTCWVTGQTKDGEKTVYKRVDGKVVAEQEIIWKNTPLNKFQIEMENRIYSGINFIPEEPVSQGANCP
ncbi:MAG: hypothetical protein EP338_04020 [Bacteroidetes bacterium]|nr:MAG: hypothetical protein EP338_04020 [Bacteroidota bacterium]